MADYVISVDAGNGGTNAVLAKKSGYNRLYFPSVRAAASGDSLGLGAQLELQYDYVDWNGHRYVYGDDVIRVTRRHLERHMGLNRYANEMQQFLIAVAVAKLGVSKGTVDLTLFAPPGAYNQLKPEILKRLLADKGQVEIRFKGDKQTRSWRYESVTVWPEGVGAAACFILNDKGELQKSSVLAGETVVLDMGAYTLDALKLVDGNFNPEALQHATWENGGLNAHIREPILSVIRKKTEDFANVTVDDIDLVLRAGLESGDYTLRAAGLAVDLQPLVDKYRERYAEWIANNIGDGVFGSFRGIKAVILVGGGTALVRDHMLKWYGSKILDPQQHATTAKIHPVDMNAVGGLRLALLRQKQQGT
ncbi:MAG: ParM/StbA family protein [Chloroflexi bacterium]|nr:ParM/StbA family protein [Chloroflexota bacterium]